MPKPSQDQGAALNFRLSIDGLPLPDFVECTGPSVKGQIVTRHQGGEKFPYKHVAGLTYGPLTIRRAITKQSSKLVEWFNNPSAKTIVIEGLAANRRDVVVKYEMFNAQPVTYTAPKFSTTKSEPAIESLEVNYEYARFW